MIRGSVTASLIGYALLMHVKEFCQLLIEISSLREKISRGLYYERTSVRQSRCDGTSSYSVTALFLETLNTAKRCHIRTQMENVHFFYIIIQD